MVWCCSCKSWTGEEALGEQGFVGGGWFVFNRVINLSVVATALWQNQCNPGVWRKLWGLILINAPSIISPSNQAFARVPLWHCLFMPQWRTVTSAVRCSLGVNRGCQSEHYSVVSLHLWIMKSREVPPLKIIRMPFFFPYPFRCGINYLASAFLPLCISLLCRSVSLLFSSSKQVSGLFCCVMWPGVKIRKVSLCSKACNFYFYPQLLELIAKSQLTSLSGIAQKNYMNILEKVVQKGKKRKQWGGGGGVWFNLMYFVWTTSLRIVRQCKMGEEEHHCLFL